jgi:DNA-binding NarL/FixJ family response regulator
VNLGAGRRAFAQCRVHTTPVRRTSRTDQPGLVGTPQHASGANARAVRVELQADCYAGVRLHSAARSGELAQSDLEDILRAAAVVGDDFQQGCRPTATPSRRVESMFTMATPPESSSSHAIAQAERRPPIRTVLADDAYLVREALKHLFEAVPGIVVVGECEDARDVVRVLDEQRADLLITDIRMPPSGRDDGIRLASELRDSHPALAVIVLSTYAEVAYALKLFEKGSDGRAYLLKDRIRDRRQVLTAVQAVMSGGSMIDPQIVEDLVTAKTTDASRLDELTTRELETLALVAEGRSNGAIAETLVLSKRAVEKHINGIFAKLELGDADHVSRRVKATLLYLADRGGPPRI